ncbi:hypothetical protein Tco_1095129, partial [Tanacetum coccineum]
EHVTTDYWVLDEVETRTLLTRQAETSYSSFLTGARECIAGNRFKLA